MTLKRVRSMARTRKKPTPAATVRIRTRSGMAGTCRARTVRSGSATVTITPMAKKTRTTRAMFRVRVSREPMASPMGIIAISAPREKRPIPTISSTAPARKRSSVPMGIGIRVALRTRTMAVMGKTEERDSRIFSLSFWLMAAAPFLNCSIGLLYQVSVSPSRRINRLETTKKEP